MSPETRSRVMSRIRGKGTKPELAMAEALGALGLSFETHAPDLAGRPDIVFRGQRVAVFVDGDFWHGWRFPVWRDKLSEQWEAKIAATIRRDRRNFQRLRRAGWAVVRVWEHQLKTDAGSCATKVASVVASRPVESLAFEREPGKQST